ncbi:GNAT family N-acetyltransferase [Bacillus cereus]|nr:GNAT family N-acetyltransferase [Bacillus cereus]PGP77919.1 GNAT family N-acetyltransferase [Bacillus cereus]
MESQLITEFTDLETAFHIRKEVFVKEQGVPLEDEFDTFDRIGEECKHILVYYNELSVGTGRIRFVDEIGKLERICILKDYRKYGLGKVIIQALEEIARNKEANKVKLHGQTHAEGFYKKLGYQTSSDVFMEDGIPHILMTKELA